MVKRSSIYSCVHCHSFSEVPDEMLLIDDTSTKLFCSEKCILTFYTPFIEEFEKMERDFRVEHRLSQFEKCFKFREDENYIRSCLENPDEIWVEKLNHSEDIHTIIRKFSDAHCGNFWMVMIAFFFQQKPSFVLYQVMTESSELVDFFRVGDCLKGDGSFSPSSSVQTNKFSQEIFDLPEDVQQEVELKKSGILASLLTLQTQADIQLEEFPFYDQYLKEVLVNPDEIYEWQDDQGDILFTYAKAIQAKGESLFYFVIGMNVTRLEGDSQSEFFVPIINFPSREIGLSNYFRKGNLLTGPLKS